MRVLILIVLVALAVGAYATWVDHGKGTAERARAAAVASAPTAEAWFSPRGGGLEAALGMVKRAKQSVLACGTFGAEAVAELVAARKRGASVQVVIAPPQGEAGALANALYDAGVAVHVDSTHARLHGAWLVIDGEILLSGPELTAAAEREQGAWIAVQSPPLVVKATDAWRAHQAHASDLGTMPEAPPAVSR